MSQLIEHTGTVIRTSQDEVEVLIEQTSACSSCSARMACATSEMQQKHIVATAVEVLKEGDTVIVFGEQRIGFRAVVLAFVLPLLLLTAALVLFTQLIASEGLAALAALACLVPYYGILSLKREKLARQLRFSARKKID